MSLYVWGALAAVVLVLGTEFATLAIRARDADSRNSTDDSDKDFR